jgi:hypothetical protein
MSTLPTRCKDINAVRTFCDCIADEDSVDEAAQAFCQRVATGSDPYVTGDDLGELKKALLDLEDE